MGPDTQKKPAALLGLMAFAVNATALSLFPNNVLALGDCLIYLSAIALGFKSMLITSLLGVVPFTLFGTELQPVLTLIVGTALAFTAKSSKTPPFIVVFFTWCLFIYPLILFAPELLSLSVEKAHLDMVFAVGCPIVLLNSDIRYLTGYKFFHLNYGSFLTHCAVLTLLFGFFLIPMCSTRSTLNALPMNSAPDFLMVWGAIMTCAFVTSRFMTNTSKNEQMLHTDSILQHSKSLSFSGESSRYWRDETTKGGAHKSSVGPISLRAQRNTHYAVLDKSLRIIELSAGFSQFLQWGKIGLKLSSTEIPRNMFNEIERLINNDKGQAGVPREVGFLDSDSVLQFVEIKVQKPHLSEIVADSRPTDGWILTLKDISELRALDKGLVQVKKNETLGLLVDELAVSGSVNLSRVFLQLQTAFSQSKEEYTKTTLQRAISGLKEAGSVIGQLSRFTGKSSSGRSPLSLGKTILEMEPVLKTVAGSQCRLTSNIGDTDYIISANEELISLALCALINTAQTSYRQSVSSNVKFPIEITVDKESFDESIGEIHVGACAGTYARVRVKDSGAGISQDILLKSVTESSTQTKITTAAMLSFVQSILKSHGGFSTIETSKGKGTTMFLYFPLLNTLEKSSESCNDDIVTKTKDTSVFVMENDNEMNKLISELLKNKGYKVQKVNHAHQLEGINSESVVLLGKVGPEISQEDLLKKIKQMSPKVPVGAISLSTEKKPLLDKSFSSPLDIDEIHHWISTGSARKS